MATSQPASKTLRRLEVAKDTKANVEREHAILEAYRDFRGALKQAEVAALDILKTAEQRLESVKAELTKAAEAVANFTADDPAGRAHLELLRDEQLRQVQNEESR